MKVVVEPLKSRIGLHPSAAQAQASQKLVAVFDRCVQFLLTVGRKVTSYQFTTSGK